MGEEPPASHIQLRFEVSDTGIGMTPEELEKAFQPFEQTADGVQASEGAGLGLPICRQLVQLMGGELQAESQPGEGSRFWFALTLPLTTAAETGATPPAQMITGYKGETRKVLVVDDNATNRAVLVDMLTPLGFEVHEAEGGRAALEQAQIARPHLILMDRFMPEMDGLAATQQLRQIPALGDLPVVSVSASVMEEDQQQALEAGHDAFLPKPVRWPQLAAILQEYLQLEWVYAEGSDESVVEGELTPPPTEELELLQELAAGGDIFALRQRAGHIEALGEQYIPFARRLHDLAADYKLLEITKFLKQFLDDEGQAQ